MKIFIGTGDLGNVSVSQHATVPEFWGSLGQPVGLKISRGAFWASSPKQRQTLKRVKYFTPAVFGSSPSPRKTENALHCNLIALDVDDPKEAIRLLSQGWEGLGELAYIVWHTASSTLGAPRLRVLVAAEKISLSHYPSAVRTVAEMLGITTVTHESLVPVQPMFWPTIFEGDAEITGFNPIVVSKPDGDSFTTADIIDAGEASLVVDGDNQPPPPDLGVADLNFLKTPMEGVILADAESALKFLDADEPMQQWIERAAALKHQFQGGEEDAAYELWDAWSSKGKKYVDSSETAYRWKTLRAQPVDRAPVTIRSLFKAAAARGWVNTTLSKRGYNDTLAWIRSETRSTEELFDQAAQRIAKVAPVIGLMEKKSLIAALREKFASRDVAMSLPDIRKEVRKLELESAKTTGIPPWSKGLCFITSLGIFYRHTTNRRFTPEVIDLMHATPAIGDEAPMRPRDYLMQIVGVQQVESLRYDPARGIQRFFTEDNVPYVNTYRPTYAKSDPDRAEEAGEIWWRHMTNLIKEEEYAKIMVDVMAYPVQHPGKKIRWATLIQGVKGCGKTAIAVAMKAVLGSKNVSKLTGSSLLEGTHNDWAYGRQLVTIEEVRVIGHNRHAVMDKLKPCISDDEIDLHCKYEPHRTVPNITNYLMFTNYHDALAIDDSERRYFVLASALQTVEDVAQMGGATYFNKLFGMIADNPGGLRSWLEQWTIDPERFNPEGRAPSTPYLFELAANSASPLASAVSQVIDEQPHALVRKDLLSLSCLRDILDTEHRVGQYSDQALVGVLHEHGWRKQVRISLEGRKHQLWSRNLKGDPRVVAMQRNEVL